MSDIDPPELPKRSIPIYKSPASCVRTGGNGAFVFSCSAEDHKLCLHDTTSTESIISLDAPTDNPLLIAVSADAEKAAYATNTGAVYIWDALYPSSMESFRPDEDAVCDIHAISWHPRGHVLAVATASGHLYLWDFVVGTLLYPVSAHEGAITAAQWTANGRLLVTVGVDATLRVWNPRNVDQVGEINASTEDNNNKALSLSAIISNSSSSNQNKSNNSGNSNTSGSTQTSHNNLHHMTAQWHTGPIRCLDTLADMSRVAITGSDDGSVLLSVLKPESMCGVFHAMMSHRAPVTDVRFAPLHTKPLRAASGAADGSIHLFDMDRRLPMGSFQQQSHRINQLTFSHSADVLFAAAGPTVIAWDARVAPDEERPVTFGGHDHHVKAFALIDNGAGLVTACHDGLLRVYDVRYPAGEVVPVDAVLAANAAAAAATQSASTT